MSLEAGSDCLIKRHPGHHASIKDWLEAADAADGVPIEIVPGVHMTMLTRSNDADRNRGSGIRKHRRPSGTMVNNAPRRQRHQRPVDQPEQSKLEHAAYT